MRTVVSYLIGIISLLCSCSNEELLEKYEAPVPIRFSTQCVEIVTKQNGAIPSSILPENTQISIFSLEHAIGEMPSTWNPGIFNNTLGTTDAVGDILYTNTYYFPIGNELDFFAVSPSLKEMGISSYTDHEEIEISLPKEATNQYDLMYASLPKQSKKSEKLVFEFKHLLSQIQFTLTKSASATVSLPLTKIEIVASSQGLFNLWKGTLTTLDGSETNFQLTTQLDINDTQDVAGSLLLFPQIPTKFILTFGNSETEEVHEVTTNGQPATWEAGINYHYTIQIDRNIPAQAASSSEITDSAEPIDTPHTPIYDTNTETEPTNPAETDVSETEPGTSTKTVTGEKSITLYLH